MEKNYFQQRNLSIKDKILSLDFKLIFLILLLGVISFFAMYSTERGNFDYYTKNHIYRFFAFFTIFIAISFINIQLWYKSAYLFYFIVLLLLIGVSFFWRYRFRLNSLDKFIFYQSTAFWTDESCSNYFSIQVLQ